jgi:hypothetical protein
MLDERIDGLQSLAVVMVDSEANFLLGIVGMTPRQAADMLYQIGDTILGINRAASSTDAEDGEP